MPDLLDGPGKSETRAVAFHRRQKTHFPARRFWEPPFWLGSFFAIFVFLAACSHAADGNGLELGSLFTDHAVLQRDVPLPIFGKGKEGEPVKVRFAGQTMETSVKNGLWEAKLPALPAGGPFDLLVESGSEKIRRSDIYVGDVWVAAGQSNMQMGFGSAPELVDRAEEFLNPLVRVFGVRLASSNAPLTDSALSQSGWHAVDKSGLKWCSIVAYLFASKYGREAGVPVGILSANQGSTGIETWMPLEAVRKVIPDVKTFSGEPFFCEGGAFAENFRSGKTQLASGLFNAMISPLVRFPVKGVLWYQGENNSGHPMNYSRLLTGLVESWREKWGNPSMPFVVVQLTSYGNGKEPRGDTFPWLREQQQLAVTGTPGSGLAITYDLGEFSDIHPHAKEGVAGRMVDTFLSFDKGGPKELGPQLKTSKVEGNHIRLGFESPGGTLVAKEVVMNKNKGMAPGTDPEAFRCPAGVLKGFEICGGDEKFVEAEAVIEGKDVVVNAPSVPEPVAIRYAWKNFALANLFDEKGYPAAPFRTDDFPPPAGFLQQ